MSACPVCGEGLDGYHETEVECRRCGESYCPDHRRPGAHDCGAGTDAPTGTFGIAAPGGAAVDRGESSPSRRPAAGARVGDEADTEDTGLGGRYREHAAVALTLLGLYLLNVPLASTEPLASSGYGSPWLYAVTGGLLVGYVLLGVASGGDYHVWANVTGAVLFLSGVLVLFPALGSIGVGATRNVISHGPGYFLGNGAPLLAYAVYRLRGR